MTDTTVPTGFTTLYGLTIACCDEDAEAFLALGHHDARRMTAAANRLLRTERLERYRPMVGELPRITHTFGTITEQPIDEDGEEGGWSFEFADQNEAGAQTVTLIEVPGLGDFELLALPSRCPDCTRLTNTAHYMRVEMRALGASGPLGHDCRSCGAVWPATSRSAPTPAAAA
ncbi:hypothetical protein LN042_34690 [Kitasatospora sp. RB6PN24]|uniref:hypothetical protein n=1 Tax=Kitasatospora humi TaxID=2893891 RepID=UPI001E411149|nr:hypothetical protein [Kitasatospora humi]MCC9312150.1 hypothetical protein [Kitasatospora humi]